MRLDEALRPVRDGLALVEAGIEASLESSAEFGDPFRSHLLNPRSKRLRPALLLLSARLLGPVRAEHGKLAVIIELLHAATLAHDDVVDGAERRRSERSLNRSCGDGIAVVFGDWLFSHAFALLAALDDPSLTRDLASVAAAICRGELRQLQARGRLDLSEEEYLSMIREKTASLFSVCGRLPARLSGEGTGRREALSRCGLLFGLGYQIVDDCMDLLGDESRTGKTMRRDLEDGKLTLPLIRLLSVASGKERETARALLLSSRPSERLDRLMALLRKVGAFRYALARAEDCFREASLSLGPFPLSSEREDLERFIRCFCDRCGEMMDSLSPSPRRA